MLAVIYLRVSTEDQAREGYSLEVQEERCRRRASELGCKRVEVFCDDVTGEILNRPALTLILERIQQGGVDYFICFDPDRLARKLMNQLVITEKIEQARVKIDFINFEWRDTPDGRLFYQLRGSIAEFEKAKILMRTSDGKKKKAEKGMLTHSPGIYGYGYDKETDTLWVNQEEARVVCMMYSWVLEAGRGQYVGPYEVARRLNDMQISPPRGPRDKSKEAYWHRGTVRRILTNETYTGTLYLRVEDSTGVKNNRYRAPEEKVSRKKRPREEWCAVQVPLIVERQIWEEVQYRLRDARRIKPGMSIEQYLLSGLVRCGAPECGHTMHGNRISRRSRVKDSIKYYRYYVCTAKSPGITGVERCRSSSVPADRLEKIVWDKVSGWLTNPQVLAMELKEQGVGENLKLLEEEIVGVRQQLDAASEERARIIRGYQKGIIPEDEGDKILIEIKERVERMEKRLAELIEESHRQQLLEEEQLAFREAVDEFAGRLQELTFEEKRHVVRLLVDKVIVEGRNVVIRGRIPGVLPGGSGLNNSEKVLDNGNFTLRGGPVDHRHTNGRDMDAIQRVVVG
ncbi:recombinase family protein [Pelotomaculum sp. PtaB.Bin117]|uniref:recombinase family protein n=1 Tax=Pelotomaculum sp. PtaB.Bin117 TaxID=1811694 RepID=UPI0009D2797C|nr:recombinase family protein [Pelotomaculum sp. PtaB.Bin117]OPX85577.1 MAG: DNA-invertase hin [Pelotomaculum sp. PtaB.Bin117]